jgi:hypothetical protein
MKHLIPAVSILWFSLMPVLCFSQDNSWIIGDWKGGYFGEKSKITKKFDSRLQIIKVYGNVFEGVVQCILPSDTTVRLHTRIMGRIYNNYLMTKLKEVLYFKDPPGQYTWAKHCFTCDSMKLTMVKKGDMVVLNGERKCDTLCNIIAQYSRRFDGVAKKKAAVKEMAYNEFSVEYNAPAAGQSGPKFVAAEATPSPISSSPTANTIVPSGHTNAALQTAATNPPTTKANTQRTNTNPAQNTNAVSAHGIQTPTGSGTQPTNAYAPIAATNSPPANSNQQPTNTNPPFLNTTPSANTAATASEPLGRYTPGIDRDNVYAASMPRSGGESFFARPIIKDSLSGSINFMAGRAMVTSGRFVVYHDSAEVTLQDNGWVDGDTVSLYYNGQIIASKVPLNLKPYSIKIPIYKGGGNLLTVYAESLGSIPPNTAYVRLICGDQETSFLLSSNMSKSSSIEIYRGAVNSD